MNSTAWTAGLDGQGEQLDSDDAGKGWFTILRLYGALVCELALEEI